MTIAHVKKTLWNLFAYFWGIFCSALILHGRVWKSVILLMPRLWIVYYSFLSALVASKVFQKCLVCYKVAKWWDQIPDSKIGKPLLERGCSGSEAVRLFVSIIPAEDLRNLISLGWNWNDVEFILKCKLRWIRAPAALSSNANVNFYLKQTLLWLD